MKNNSTLTKSSRHDNDILKAAISGDVDAFNQFMDQYKEALSSMIIRMIHNKEETEVLTEKICKTAFTNIHCYNHEITLCGWLFRLASEAAINHLRDRLRKKPDHPSLNKNGGKTPLNLNRHINLSTSTQNHKSQITNNPANEIKIEELCNNDLNQKEDHSKYVMNENRRETHKPNHHIYGNISGAARISSPHNNNFLAEISKLQAISTRFIKQLKISFNY